MFPLWIFMSLFPFSIFKALVPHCVLFSLSLSLLLTFSLFSYFIFNIQCLGVKPNLHFTIVAYIYIRKPLSAPCKLAKHFQALAQNTSNSNQYGDLWRKEFSKQTCQQSPPSHLVVDFIVQTLKLSHFRIFFSLEPRKMFYHKCEAKTIPPINEDSTPTLCCIHVP